MILIDFILVLTLTMCYKNMQRLLSITRIRQLFREKIKIKESDRLKYLFLPVGFQIRISWSGSMHMLIDLICLEYFMNLVDL